MKTLTIWNMNGTITLFNNVNDYEIHRRWLIIDTTEHSNKVYINMDNIMGYSIS